jgi:hypothetical protein
MNYRFYDNCVGWNPSDLESLEQMIDDGEEITYDELTEYVTEETLDKEFPMYRGCPLTLETDWHVHYFKSTLHGKHCVYVVHSCIEYVFVPRNF